MFRAPSVQEKILLSVFLLQEKTEPILSAIRPQWPDHSCLPLADRLLFLETAGIVADISLLFPLTERLSSAVSDAKGFALSHLRQPRLFLRIRPGREDAVKQKLFSAKIPFNQQDHAVELANGTDINDILNIDRDVVIQDLSSQRTGGLMSQIISVSAAEPEVWDCCAASGGKSILLYDNCPGIRLTVSDIRSTILENLHKRFSAAGIHRYKAFVADLSKSVANAGVFDVILADVPCSGSGTWGRTPESLLYFTEKDLDHYTDLQRRIIQHTLPSVRPGGHYLYMTCSVYAAENEEQVAFIQQQGLHLQEARLLEGWQSDADTLFAAWFTK